MNESTCRRCGESRVRLKEVRGNAFGYPTPLWGLYECESCGEQTGRYLSADYGNDAGQSGWVSAVNQVKAFAETPDTELQAMREQIDKLSESPKEMPA